MNSLVYKGHIDHFRMYPAKHGFDYPFYFYAFDLDELENIDSKYRFFSYNNFNLFSINDKDKLNPVKGSIKEKLIGLISNEVQTDKICRITVITWPKVLGMGFNPAGFYYCHDAAGDLICIAVEVNNTHGERYLYLLKESILSQKGYKYGFKQNKNMYITPFNDIEGYYELYFTDIGKDLKILIKYKIKDKGVITVKMEGVGEAITPYSMGRAMSTMSFMTLLVMLIIYVHGFILWLGKKLRVVPKAQPSGTGVLLEKHPDAIERFFMRRFFELLSVIKKGCIEVVLPSGEKKIFGDTQDVKKAQLKVKRYWFFLQTGLFGDIGFGEAYVEKTWDTEDLFTLMTIMIENLEEIDKQLKKFRVFNYFADVVKHRARKNTRKNARSNISEHYDISNDLFRLFLDKGMQYSSAVYGSQDETLEAAQENKINRIIKMADIKEGEHVLEIGSGWGAMAAGIAKKIKCRVTTITVSTEQYNHVKELINEEGLNGKVEVKLCDYRDIEGDYDKIISIEMLEAVGHEFLPEYFTKCDRLLKDGGRAVYQVITIPDDKYDEYMKSCDWIQKHIFPGGHLLSLKEIKRVTEKHTSLKLCGMENVADSYALTLKEWKRRFEKNRQKIYGMGYDDEFFRKWIYYFTYCEAAFASKYLSDLQISFVKKEAKK
ncbi:MAG: DUF1365 family protein [Candidatus Omnitrophica bacterium]|nr:DUF1365 family protein [Candidatus Omnitrophota bacterium]